MFFSRKSKIIAYTVHEAPDAPSDRGDRAEALVFVPDGFSFAAFLLAPIWLPLKRLWLPAIGYLVVVVLMVLIVALSGLHLRWLLLSILALHLIIGFEADSLIRWSMDRNGWRLISSVTGSSYEECERRFFKSWLSTIPAVATGNLTPPGTAGGLHTTTGARSSVPPVTGEIIPPKRTGRLSGFSFRK